MAQELERRIVAIEVVGGDKAVHTYRQITAEGDKMTRQTMGFGAGLSATNAKLGQLAMGGANVFRALTSGGASAAGAIIGIGGAAVAAIGGVAMSAVKMLISGLLTATKVAMGLAAAATAVGAAFAKSAISAAIERDTQMRSLTSLMGAGAAQQHFGDLRQVAKLPGMDLNSAMQFSRGLQAVNVNAETTLRLLRAIANALALSGKGPEELGRVGIQLQQMFAKGKVMAEDVIIVSESLPQFRQAIKNAFGTSDTETLIKRGMTATEVIAGVVSQLEKLPKATSGPANALVNLKMAWNDLLVGFGEAFTKAGGIEVINKLAEGFAKLVPVMTQFGVLAASVLPNVAKSISEAFTFISDPDRINRWAKAAINAVGQFAQFILRIIPQVVKAFGTMGDAWGLILRTMGRMIEFIGKHGVGLMPVQDLIKAQELGRSLQKMGEDTDTIGAAFERAGKRATDFATKAMADVVTWQNAASAAIDRTTAAIKQQAQAMAQVAQATKAAVQAGSAYSFSANGNAYNAYTFGQAAGMPIVQNGFFGSAAQFPQGAMTHEQHQANVRATAAQKEAEARARSIAAIEAEARARQEYQQWLTGQLKSVAGGSVSDFAKNSLNTVRQYQQAEDMARRLPGTWMAQAAQATMMQLAPVLKAIGFSDPRQMPAYLAALLPKTMAEAAAKESKSVTIEGDYREQRRREQLSLTERLQASVLGNLGAGDQSILAQGKLGTSQLFTSAAQQAGKSMAGQVADAIARELPLAFERAFSRRLRVDLQGAQ